MTSYNSKSSKATAPVEPDENHAPNRPTPVTPAPAGKANDRDTCCHAAAAPVKGNVVSVPSSSARLPQVFVVDRVFKAQAL